MKYPHSVVVQFRITGQHAMGWGSADELDFRNAQEEKLGELLELHGLGECDGGQMGGGAMEVFFYVADIESAVKLLMDALTNDELIGFCKIASHENSGGLLDNLNTDKWSVHYPPGANFSLWRFDV